MALSDKAKWHAVIGAMVVDRAFRDALIANESERGAMIDAYSTTYHVEIGAALRDQMVQALFQPCIADLQAMLNDKVNASRICPCWPCVMLTVAPAERAE
jgi:hypothetical protein